MGSIVVLGNWVTAACAMLYCEWLLRSFWHRRLTGCLLPCGKKRVVSSILAILAPSHDIFYCYDIPRYIVTFAHVSIDDKYRGIAGIAQHYWGLLLKFVIAGTASPHVLLLLSLQKHHYGSPSLACKVWLDKVDVNLIVKNSTMQIIVAAW